VFIDGLCFKIENLCPSTAFFYVSIFAVEKATKNRKLSLLSIQTTRPMRIFTGQRAKFRFHRLMDR
jgi:hypothetical protein